MSKIIADHIVINLAKPTRLNQYLKGVFPQLPSGQSIKKALKNNRILVNGQIENSSYWVKIKDKIDLKEDTEKFKIFPLELKIEYEDNHLAIIIKPAGIATHSNYNRCIHNALAYNISRSPEKDALNRPQAIHRLDYLTGGLMVIAKTSLSQITLGRYFEKHQIQKTYTAICSGIPKSTQGVINFNINGKEAISNYQVLKSINTYSLGKFSVIECQPITGRTHQLRIHLSQLGCPILGDPLYNTGDNWHPKKGLFLYATKIKFNHPIDNSPISRAITPSKKFERTLKYLERKALP